LSPRDLQQPRGILVRVSQRQQAGDAQHDVVAFRAR
jgi:hypothetical protein